MTEYVVEYKEYESLTGMVFCQPLARKEEIVRCRDCVNCYFDFSSWMCGEFGFGVGNEDDGEPDGFCAWAVRRVDE